MVRFETRRGTVAVYVEGEGMYRLTDRHLVTSMHVASLDTPRFSASYGSNDSSASFCSSDSSASSCSSDLSP